MLKKFDPDTRELSLLLHLMMMMIMMPLKTCISSSVRLLVVVVFFLCVCADWMWAGPSEVAACPPGSEVKVGGPPLLQAEPSTPIVMVGLL